MLEALFIIIVAIYLIGYGIAKLLSKHKGKIKHMGFIGKLAASCFVASVCAWIINKFIINTFFYESVCKYGLVAALILFAIQICVWIFVAE